MHNALAPVPDRGACGVGARLEPIPFFRPHGGFQTGLSGFVALPPTVCPPGRRLKTGRINAGFEGVLETLS